MVEGSLAGISRKPLSKHRNRVTIWEDGEVQIGLQAKLRKDAVWLPRFGFEFELPECNSAFSYYGRGPLENYCDMNHSSYIGRYESNAEKEYVPYVRPQEHGNHTEVKWIRIGNMVIEAEKEMEIQVSKYDTKAVTLAEHTDELTADGKKHLRIDYKVSGMGSNACGPALAEKYRLHEKNIEFGFRIRPI